MSIATRILLGYVVVLGVIGYFLFSSSRDALKPGMRQSAEETLVDTANLLAELVADDVKEGTVANGEFAAKLRAYGTRSFGADIWGVTKTRANHRIYVTDARGRVIYDSMGRDIGADYSRWNDVHLTLQGRYGARSTPDNPADPDTTVMYVAAPIKDGDRIIGVLTVGKPNLSMQPFIDRAQRELIIGGAIALLGALAAGAAISWWTTRSVRALAAYAHDASAGKRVALPPIPEPELAQLGAALEEMRARLDGRAYVEQYVQTLTHELKSPIASILGAAELLNGDLPPADRERFLANVTSEADRMKQVIERLLDLAVIEQRRGLEEQTPINLADMVNDLIEQRDARFRVKRLEARNRVPNEAIVSGERFLVQQALANLLDNALAFTPEDGKIEFDAARVDTGWQLRCRNTGPAIPDFALPRLTERFFSLPQPGTGRKSSGLGLSFVAQVAELHAGHLQLTNHPDGGVVAALTLPAA